LEHSCPLIGGCILHPKRRNAVKEVGAGSLSCDLAVGLGRSLNFVDWHDDETSSRTPDNNSKLMVRQTNLLAYDFVLWRCIRVAREEARNQDNCCSFHCTTSSSRHDFRVGARVITVYGKFAVDRLNFTGFRFGARRWNSSARHRKATQDAGWRNRRAGLFRFAWDLIGPELERTTQTADRGRLAAPPAGTCRISPSLVSYCTEPSSLTVPRPRSQAPGGHQLAWGPAPVAFAWALAV
jgi:hypothetical protein